MGLEIAHALKDEKHKSLYIKLAKERSGEGLLRLAKEIAEKRNVKNRGAYFMAVIRILAMANDIWVVGDKKEEKFLREEDR